jgi:hypothetical protein
MRRAFIPWLVVGLALVAIAVPIAQGTSSAKDPRVAGLIKKVNALNKQVAALVVKSNCLGAQGIVLRGTVATEGYAFTADSGATFVLRSAFDAPVTGETPQGLFATVNPACAGGSHTLYRSSKTFSGTSRHLR